MKKAKASSPEISRRMKSLKKSGTSIELEVGQILWANGVRYRKNVRGLPGRPDFANKGRRWAIFVNGCFWHHHTNCVRATIPKSNRSFWEEKFAANRTRDAHAIKKLRTAGYLVKTVWECERPKIADRLRQILEPRRVHR
jgi:DNA mismatch endonuclease (patch repair protein)